MPTANDGGWTLYKAPPSPPTAKMIHCCEVIHDVLGQALPADYKKDFKVARRYIKKYLLDSKHCSEYRREMARMNYVSRSERRPYRNFQDDCDYMEYECMQEYCLPAWGNS